MKINRWPPEDPRNLVFGRCESPIEQTLCFELFERTWVPAASSASQVGLFAQVPIGPYIADFVLTTKTRRDVVIECDGMEFHRGREGYDEERDDWMIDQGYGVLRFSGSDIWMRPDDVLARIGQSIGGLVIVPGSVPQQYLRPDCAAMLPLLLRRGRSEMPLLSFVTSPYAEPDALVQQWLLTGKALITAPNEKSPSPPPAVEVNMKYWLSRLSE